jgi:dTDP-4-dehydrorhamnose reductase
MTQAHAIPIGAAPAQAAGRALLIGGNGMLGRAWRQLLAKHEIECASPSRAELNITEPATVEHAVTAEFGTVINCAAWTDVDGAEADPAGAQVVNAAGVANLARRCGRVGATLVHYSTDYVFNGAGDAPYETDHPADPLNAYGRSKLAGEIALQRAGCRYLLIRTSWLYAPWGKNFVRTIAKLCREKPTLRVVNDQRGRPTSSEHLAELTLRLLERGCTGIYHGCDGGECTWFEFARQIAIGLKSPCRIEPCTSAEHLRPARRPAYSVLSLDRTEAEIGPMPDWRDNLASVLRRLE